MMMMMMGRGRHGSAKGRPRETGNVWCKQNGVVIANGKVMRLSFSTFLNGTRGVLLLIQRTVDSFSERSVVRVMDGSGDGLQKAVIPFVIPVGVYEFGMIHFIIAACALFAPNTCCDRCPSRIHSNRQPPSSTAKHPFHYKPLSNKS